MRFLCPVHVHACGGTRLPDGLPMGPGHHGLLVPSAGGRNTPTVNGLPIGPQTLPITTVHNLRLLPPDCMIKNYARPSPPPAATWDTAHMSAILPLCPYITPPHPRRVTYPRGGTQPPAGRCCRTAAVRSVQIPTATAASAPCTAGCRPAAARRTAPSTTSRPPAPAGRRWCRCRQLPAAARTCPHRTTVRWRCRCRTWRSCRTGRWRCRCRTPAARPCRCHCPRGILVGWWRGSGCRTAAAGPACRGGAGRPTGRMGRMSRLLDRVIAE